MDTIKKNDKVLCIKSRYTNNIHNFEIKNNETKPILLFEKNKLYTILLHDNKNNNVAIGSSSTMVTLWRWYFLDNDFTNGKLNESTSYIWSDLCTSALLLDE